MHDRARSYVRMGDTVGGHGRHQLSYAPRMGPDGGQLSGESGVDLVVEAGGAD